MNRLKKMEYLYLIALYKIQDLSNTGIYQVFSEFINIKELYNLRSRNKTNYSSKPAIFISTENQFESLSNEDSKKTFHFSI